MKLFDCGLDRKWITADDDPFEVLQGSDDGFRLPLQRGLANAADAGVGLQLDEDEIRARDIGYKNALRDNFQGCPLFRHGVTTRHRLR